MKLEKVSFSIMGGDLRQIKLCNHLIDHGYQVKVFGFSNSLVNPLAKRSSNLEEAVEGSDVIIGPIPCSQNNQDLFTKYHEKTVLLEDMLRMIKKDQIFMAGRLTNKMKIILAEEGISSIDLLERDDMAIRNAIPTGSCF